MLIANGYNENIGVWHVTTETNIQSHNHHHRHCQRHRHIYFLIWMVIAGAAPVAGRHMERGKGGGGGCDRGSEVGGSACS